jgi:hypothetical protein
MAFEINKNFEGLGKTVAFSIGDKSKTVSLTGEPYTYKTKKGKEITIQPATQEDLEHLFKLKVKYVVEKPLDKKAIDKPA